MLIKGPIAHDTGITNGTGSSAELAIAKPDQGHDAFRGRHRQHILTPESVLIPDSSHPHLHRDHGHFL
jgi:hypothetical protein